MVENGFFDSFRLRSQNLDRAILSQIRIQRKKLRKKILNHNQQKYASLCNDLVFACLTCSTDECIAA